MIYWVTCFILIVFFFSGIHPQVTKNNKNKVYTSEELRALDQLRNEVKSNLYLDYHNQNSYLINWLRNKKLDVPKAASALKSSLRYRKENKIDGVLQEEEMLQMHKSYPATFGAAVDYEGNPAYQVVFSKWDIRRTMLAGKRDALARYIFFIFESSMAAARAINSNNFVFFADMSNYSLRKHSCLACLPYYVDLITTYERHYPNGASVVIAINTPRIFETASNLMLPLMSEETQKIYNIFGPDKEEWQKFVLQRFPADQLTKQFGGNKSS